MSKTNTTTLREYEAHVHYHTNEVGKMKIIARNPEDAIEIAKMNFAKSYTDKCVLDKVEVLS